MRAALVAVHRWVGLAMAVFLVIAGLTGAVISWDHELDEWLNPHLNEAPGRGPAPPALQWVAEIEQRHPQVKVSYVPMAVEPGHALAFGVEPRPDPVTGALAEPGFNQVFIDPVTGAELGRRQWGAVWPLGRENLVSFLYVLHYSLHLPAWGGIDRWGVWLMGVVAVFWTVDCFTGFYLTLPPARRAGPAGASAARRGAGAATASRPASGGKSWWARWQPAWRVRWQGGASKLNFDLHRAGSLWTWALLFVLAFTAFSLNLYREVFFPVMSLVSEVTPTPFEQRTPSSQPGGVAPRLDYAQALQAAQGQARARGWTEPVGSVYHAALYDLYGVQFYRPEDGHGAGGVGHRTLFIDASDGRVLGQRVPWEGSAADLFVQAQFPLHSGRILGLPGRILISVMGLVVAMLSITGVLIWWRKHRARRDQARSLAAAAPGAADDPAQAPARGPQTLTARGSRV
ncbi:PepSY-associated TM helix domain-containing protein [Curvibacter sp. HBC61]|uniref:PepSY-associated TM helix domain-containing protein n=1 Tax=Curvibacter cyanobacteriorum TaxID=3026422 RepID=A0ABT5N1P9_9BURK|nr:PepSY-associated TM helix domain-containing protein [Curvibacter sp. HBC61]MDD0840190.1 PepSY-associated TM helix domain-containing protein [Curvibacter sp. HBC61]